MIPGLGGSPEEGNGNPVQYSCLENPMDREAWWATVPKSHKEWDTTEQMSTDAHIWHLPFWGASLIAQLVKNPSAMQETPAQFLGQEDLLEKE